MHWTTLDYVLDIPGDASGVTRVTVSVVDHPEIVLLDSIQVAGAAANTGSQSLEPLLGVLSQQATLALDVVTSTTPDGEMVSSAKVAASYECVSTPP